MLDKVKVALRISSNDFDDELNVLIASAVIDLGIGGVECNALTPTTTDAIITRAIISYCSYQFELTQGNIDKANAVKIAYDEQKSQLSMCSDYTNF